MKWYLMSVVLLVGCVLLAHAVTSQPITVTTGSTQATVTGSPQCFYISNSQTATLSVQQSSGTVTVGPLQAPSGTILHVCLSVSVAQ